MHRSLVRCHEVQNWVRLGSHDKGNQAMTQTTSIDTQQVRGILLEHSDDRIVLGLANSDYQLHLQIDRPLDGNTVTKATNVSNRQLTGVIRAQARRVDVVRAGGRYIEPVYGRPRRIQGTVVACDRQENTITVLARCPFVCRLSGSQKTNDFETGCLVSFDVEPVAIFEPVE